MNGQDLEQRAREFALSVERALGWRNKELQSDIELAGLLSKAMDLLSIIDNAGKVEQPGTCKWMAEVCRAAAASLEAHGVLNEQLPKVADWIAHQPAPVVDDADATEILALSLDEFGYHTEAKNVRAGEDLDEYRIEMWAIRAALARTQGVQS